MALTKLDDLISKKKSFTPAQILGLDKQKKSITIIIDDNNNNNDDIQVLPTPPPSIKKKPTNLMQLLSGNKPKSLIVTLKLPLIKNYQPDNNIIKNINGKSLIVSFKYKPIMKNNNYKIHPSTSNHPFFKSIYNKLNSNNQINKTETKIIKQIVLELPKIDKSNFKVKNLSNDEIIFMNNKSNIKFLNSLILKSKINTNLSFIDLDFSLFYSKYNSVKQNNDYNKFKNFIKTIDMEENLNMKLINERYSYLKFDERFNKFFELNYCKLLKNNNIDLWCNIYKPLNHLQNLQKQYISNDIFNWLTMAFNKLKSVNILKRKQKLLSSSSKKNLKELDSFIVYSDEEDEINNELDYSTNVPSLIIEGPIGCGKTTMIHSIINNELNGFVFEFNSNQSRARKDLDFNLKQIGTTSMVKQKKTVILFDDVNLIDETNGDKDFWLGINDLLTYSYRPVIFITDDLKHIPNNIVNESTIYKFNKIEKNEIYQYLDLISLSRNLNLDSKILDKLSLNDLRKSIIELQMFSYHFDLSNVGLTNITILNDNDNKDNNKESNKDNNKLEQLNNLYNKFELEYYTNPKRKYKDNNNIISNKFETDRLSSIEFYSSKYFSNGSRSKMCRYMDANDYNKKHPDNSFYNLPPTKIATDILGIIRIMAQREFLRVQNRNPRRFDHDPVDVFDDLFIHL